MSKQTRYRLVRIDAAVRPLYTVKARLEVGFGRNSFVAVAMLS